MTMIVDEKTLNLNPEESIEEDVDTATQFEIKINTDKFLFLLNQCLF